MLRFTVRASNLLHSLKNDRRGVTAMEYGIIAAIMVLVVGAGYTTLGTVLTTKLTAIGAALTAVGG